MPSKRKYSCIDSNALPGKITPPAPQKSGKLKSILKRPSPPSRLLASTPTAQIRLEFNAATLNASGDKPPKREDADAHPKTPRSIKKLKLETNCETSTTEVTLFTHSPLTDFALDVIEDSAAKTELPKPLARKSASPKYENDGDAELMITDSKLQASHLGETHLMSGGLGLGGSPYKGTTLAINAKPSERQRKRKKMVKNADVLKVSPPRIQSAEDLKQVKCEQDESPKPEVKENPAQCAAPSKVRINEEYLSSLEGDHEAIERTRAKHSSALPTPPSAEPPAMAKLELGAVATRIDAKHDAQRHIAEETQSSPSLANVSRILQEYESIRENEKEVLQSAVQCAQARTAQLEAQLRMLHNEITNQSKERKLQYSWHFNKYAIFSRRTHILQDDEETRVIAGCDDLEEANEITRGLFQSEMSKLESIVEDLGQARSFIDMNCGMSQVQMRLTACGMAKCRSYFADSQWDLTVERVATG